MVHPSSVQTNFRSVTPKKVQGMHFQTFSGGKDA